MKYQPDWLDDGERHDYCINTACHAPEPQKVSRNKCVNPDCNIRRTGDEGTHFHCRACGQCQERRVVLDPDSNWWVAEDDEIWHESAGVFIRDTDGRFLFYWRSIFPAGNLTVPSGHADKGETPLEAAIRELREEIVSGLPDLPTDRFEYIATEEIEGDSCLRGSDAHLWHAFRVALSSPIRLEAVKVNGEGREPELLTLAEARAMSLADAKTLDVAALTPEEAKTEALSYPVRYVIKRHAARLES